MFNFKSKATSEAFVSDERFHPSNTQRMTATEIQTAINEQKKAAPAHGVVVSAMDIFGEESTWGVPNQGIQSYIVEGKTIRFKKLKRAIADLVITKTTDDAKDLAGWLSDLAKQLRKAAPAIDKARRTNIEVRINNDAIEDLTALYRVQAQHEHNLNEQAVNAIEHSERQEQRIAALESKLAEVLLAQETDDTDTTSEDK